MEVYNNNINKEIKKLLNQKNLESLILLLTDENKSNIKNINTNNLNRILSMLERSEEYDKALCLYNCFIDGEKKNIDEQTSTVIIRCYLNINNLQNAKLVLNNVKKSDIRKRTLMPFIKYYYSKKMCQEGFEFFELYLNNIYDLDSNDYQYLFLLFINNSKYINKLMNRMHGKPIEFDNINNTLINVSSIKDNKCVNCHENLQIVYLTDNERLKLILNLQEIYIKKKNKKIFDKYKKFLDDKKFKYIIDGANILYFGDREVNYNSYIKLDTLINYLKKKVADNKQILLVIHTRHLNNLNQNNNLTFYDISKIKKFISKWYKSITIFCTPFGMNDDWYSIYSGLINKESYVLSNDLFKDHIFKISELIDYENIFSKWYEYSQIKYEFPNKNYREVCVIDPIKYSRRVQLNNNSWHIPYNNKSFICL